VNALEIVRTVCGVIGLQQPNSLIGTSDLQVIQLRELLDKEGSELAARSSSGWQSLVREVTFTTVAQENQGAIETIIGASNSFRHILNDTIWNRTTKEPVYGPRAPRVWQGYKAVTFAGPYAEYRIRDGSILFLPVPSAGDTCAFEYVTRNWLESEDGTATRAKIADDEDVPLLDAEILALGLEWRWRKAKGLDYGQEHADYESRVIDALARDGTKPRVDIAGESIPDDIPMAIPRLIGT
jgi:hypothetical protein